MYVRREAVLSSQIEGTQSSLSDLLVFESDATPGVPIEDVREVATYVAALRHGVDSVRSGLPISNRLIREVHAILLQTGRGSRSDPGEFRRSQVWLGGTRPGNALFVPPPPYEVAGCMSDLERWLNNEPVATPTLIKAALAHVQFETIHPFLDGNGRVGRMLVTLLLAAEEVLAEPLLYLSLWFKQNRAQYYELLTRVRTDGVWEEWLQFFAEGIAVTAVGAVETAKRVSRLVGTHRELVKQSGPSSGNALRLHQAMLQKPVSSATDLAGRTGLAMPTVNRLLDLLAKLDIVHELTGRQRGRLFSYARYVEILSEGTAPLPR